jgi:hypothetical protein
MTRIKRLPLAAPLFGAALLFFACNGSPSPLPQAKATEPPPAKRTAEALAKEWTFGPEKDQKPQSYASNSSKSDESVMVTTIRLSEEGKAKEWFARAAKYYAEKCGADPAVVKKNVVGHTGESKSKGRYLIKTVPDLLLVPANEIRPEPAEFLFTYHDADSTLTVDVRQQGEDVLLIILTVAIRSR